MDINALYRLKHLSETEVSDVIKEIGLYTPLLVDTFSNNTKYDSSKWSVTISPDVKQLYSLIFPKSPRYLPCAVCKKELAFNQVNNRSETVISYTSDPQNYCFNSEIMFIADNRSDEESFKNAAIACKEVLLSNLTFFVVELSCSLDSKHIIRCMFSLSPFEVDSGTEALYRQYTVKKLKAQLDNSKHFEVTDAEKEAVKLYEIAEHTLVLRKVGQFPSMADMQFYNLQKYRNLLKGRYSELTRAVGLYSSGIGIGAFVYLRRIFESICEEAHQAYISAPNWNEDEYAKMRFNEKMDYLSQFGQKVLPDELNPIKSKLYGVMSKGVHEYSETECQELFPYIQTAIELILDQKLANIERYKKINELTNAIQNAKSK